MNTLTKKSTETMSSKEIAAFTGKRHSHLMRDIRNMEVAWEKVNGTKFGLVTYIDSKGEPRPMFVLNKRECLYIATKFNDEARAKLIVRWEELENEKLNGGFVIPKTMSEALMLAAKQTEQLELAQAQIQHQAPVVEYAKNVLKSDNGHTSTVIANQLNMSAITLNRILQIGKFLRKTGQEYSLTAQHQGKGYTVTETFTYTRSDGSSGTKIDLRFTEKGRREIHEVVKRAITAGALIEVKGRMQIDNSWYTKYLKSKKGATK